MLLDRYRHRDTRVDIGAVVYANRGRIIAAVDQIAAESDQNVFFPGEIQRLRRARRVRGIIESVT